MQDVEDGEELPLVDDDSASDEQEGGPGTGLPDSDGSEAEESLFPDTNIDLRVQRSDGGK